MKIKNRFLTSPICQQTDKIKNRFFQRSLLQEASDMACWEREDAWLASEPTLIYAKPDTSGMVSLLLLSGHNYMSGTYQGKLYDGSDWEGVTCQVDTNDPDIMTLIYTVETPEHSGYCPIAADDDKVLKVPAELFRI